jgi:large subunit ribosomal protein L3
MIKAFLGKKLNMTQVFDTHGRSIPVTVVSASANLVTGIKDGEKDGYKAVQIGYGEAKRVQKPVMGQLKKAVKKDGLYPRVLKEVGFDSDVKVGQRIKIDEVFAKGSMVDVLGVTKGKGFAGVVKRYGFKGGPKTHGQSDRHRAPGSIGATTTPGRVFKGLRMGGHMGVDQLTVQGLEVINIDPETETILLKGALPGPKGSIVLIKKSLKKRKKYHEPVIQHINVGGGAEEEKSAETSEDGAVTENQAEAGEKPVETTEKEVTESSGEANGAN